MLLLFGGSIPAQNIVASGIPSEEDFVGNDFGGPFGGEAYGGGVTQDSITVTINTTSRLIEPTGIASIEAFGTHQINLTIHGTGIASTEAFGTATLVPELDTTSIASGEAFGSHQINLTVHVSGIASAESVSNPTVVAGVVTVLPTGIASAEEFGSPTVDLTIHVTGIASAEAFGAPMVGRLEILPTAIASAEAFGTTELVYVITPDGVASGEAVGEAQLIPGAVTVLPSGIPTEETVSTGIILFNDVVWVEINQTVTIVELIQIIDAVSPVQTIVTEDTSSQTDADETLRVKELVL